MLKAVQNNGEALKYASIELRDNYEIVYAAVSNCSYARRYASKKLQDHPEIVYKIISKISSSEDYSLAEFRQNMHYIVLIAQINGIDAVNFGCSELYAKYKKN